MNYVLSPVRRLETALIGVVVLSLSIFPLVPSASAITAEYQQCPVNSSCTIGEFLYEDDGTPLTGATCTYTSRKPDGTLFTNAASMTGASDAWYSYDVNTTAAVEGLYRGTVCCTPPGADPVCIERSFVVGAAALSAQDVENAVWDATRADHTSTGSFGENLQNPSSISVADIWSYPSRSLTSFGSLVNDIWSSSSRNLTGFGDLVGSIWTSSSRSLTTNDLGDNEYLFMSNNSGAISPSSLTSSTTLNQTTITYNTLSQQLAETRTLLERLVNEPIVETFIDDKPSEDLNSKLQHTEQLLLSLQEHVTRASNSTDLVLLTWNSVDPLKISEGLDSTIQLLGKNVDSPHPQTILDSTQRLAELWSSYQLTSTVDQSKAALVSAIKTRNELTIDGKSNATRQALEETAKFVGMLKTLIGTEDDEYTQATAFGFLRDMQKKAEALTQQRQTINTVLSEWDASSEAQRDQLLATVSKEVHAVNAIPSAQLVTTPAKQADTTDLRQKNTTYSLKALISANERLLASAPNSMVNLVWFEEGSVIFRFLATNPSTTISQTVNIVYPLPIEVDRDDILEYDPFLAVMYDPAISAYVLSGTVTLNPSESKTFSVDVVDVWKIPQEQIDALQKDAALVYESLKKTQYAGQAEAVKMNTDAAVLAIMNSQSNSTAPEVRIRTYRENQLSLVTIKQDITNLAMLAASTSVSRTAFGFVGGVQVIILWGMVIVLMAGFIYLALYTHAIRFKFKMDKKQPGRTKRPPHKPIPIWKRVTIALFLSTIATSTTASFGSALLARQGIERARSIASNQYPTVLGTSIATPQQSILMGSEVPVATHASPDVNSQLYHKIPEDIYVTTKAKSKNWVQIQYTWGGLVYIGWVEQSNLQPIKE